MRIVVTHGRGPTFEIPATMAREWRDALLFGLERVGLANTNELDIRFTFYGDIWRPDRRAMPDEPSGDDGRDTSLAGRGTGLDAERADEEAVDAALREPSTDLQAALADDILPPDPDAERLDWNRLAEIVTRLDEVFGAGKIALTHFLKDVDEYFRSREIREKALEALRRACLEAPGPSLLMGHGTGSIVAYDLLATDGADALGVESLLTFGSPLGMPSLRKQVEWIHQRTPFPTGLRRWLNVYNEKDFATVVREVTKLYRAHDGRRVENVAALGQEPSLLGPGKAHDPTTYLSSMALAEAVRDVILPKTGGRGRHLVPPVDLERDTEPVRGIDLGGPSPYELGTAEPVATQPDPRTPGTRVVERTASADFPPVVAPGATHELLVAIAGLAVHARSEALVPLVVPVDQHALALRVGVYAADFDVKAADDPRRAWMDMTVDLDDLDAVAEARFKLTAHQGDRRRESPIYVTFYRGNLPVGQLMLLCVIDPVHEIRSALISATIGGASDPEYVLVVSDRSQGLKGAGPFDIFVSKEGEYINKPLGSFPVAVDAWHYASARLDGFRRVREEPTTEDRIRAAEALGIELWNDLPDEFKRFYWEELHEHLGASLAIYSQEPYIPWELIKPQREVGGEEDGFVGATMQMARWKQAIRFPDPLTVTGFSVIAPEYGPDSGSRPLPGAQAEAQQLIAEFGAQPVPGERAVIREMLESSLGIQLIHFAGHGDFDPEAAEVSVIRLGDLPLIPRDLSRAKLGRTAHPFVFLNACEVGEQGWALTKIGGWAEAFIDVGFSGFIGPYWAVNDRIARKSALLFYRSLWAGLTVGETIRQIRLQFYADPDDAGHPSWLAYTLHCQPNIHIQLPKEPITMPDGTAARVEPVARGEDR